METLESLLEQVEDPITKLLIHKAYVLGQQAAIIKAMEIIKNPYKI